MSDLTFSPAPKPAPTVKPPKERKPRTPIARKTPMPKAAKPVRARNAKRRAREFARCYGSSERVEWVKSLACAASGVFSVAWPVENAHVCDDGSKGAGRKAGSRCIAPLSREAHRLLHDDPDAFAARYPHFNAERAAASTETAWQAECARRSQTGANTSGHPSQDGRR